MNNSGGITVCPLLVYLFPAFSSLRLDLAVIEKKIALYAGRYTSKCPHRKCLLPESQVSQLAGLNFLVLMDQKPPLG